MIELKIFYYYYYLSNINNIDLNLILKNNLIVK